jgi:hypothetical protein
LYFDFFNYVWGCSASFVFEQLKKEERLLRKIFGESRSVPVQALFVNGLNLRSILQSGVSTLLLRRSDGSMGVLMMHLRDAASIAEAEVVASNFLPKAGQTQNAEVQIEETVSQMIIEAKTIADFRSGLVIPAEPSPEEFRAFLLSTLPLPEEVRL